MTKTVLKVEGMSCAMCSGGVTASLLRVKGVTDAKVDLKKGTAEVIHEGVSDDILIRAVVDAGYKAKVKSGLF